MAIQRRDGPRFQNLQRRVSPRFQNLQRRVSPRFHNLQRRVSPRFQNIRKGGNSNIGKTRNASESRKISNTQNLPRGGNSNIEKIWNAYESGKTSHTRVNLRFQNLPNEEIRDATDSRKTSSTRVSPRFQSLPNNGSSNTEKIHNVLDSGKISNTRVSPRLQSVPLEKRPYYGSCQNRKTLNDSHGNSNIKKIQNVIESLKISDTRVSPRLQSIPLEKRPYYGSFRERKTLNDSHDNSNIEKIENVLDSRKTSNARVSPRFQSIPWEKKPYYGSCRKRKTLNDSHGNSNIEKIQDVLDSGKTSNARVSPRFQSIPWEKRPYYGSCRKRKTMNVSQDTIMVKKHKVGNADLECVSNGSVTTESGEKDVAYLQETDIKGGNYGDDLASTHGTSAAMAVKDKLRLFNKYFLHFSKEEYACEGNVKQSKCQGHFNLSKCKDCVKQSKSCPDLMAISEMLKKNEILSHERYFGDLPGIEIGHCFYFRAEMVAVGLHKLLLKGIDYIGEHYVKSEYSGYTFPLAASVVLSGQYEDDFDNSEEIVYTGEGGNDLLGDKHQIKDQVMLRGNLALKNNKEQSVPVRVIRGHKCDDSYSKTVYIYDGLYKVTDYWDEKGISGFKVFKYRLKRLQGQDNLMTRNQAIYFSLIKIL
ncbi:uncharacterized protein LOC120178237 [Hibiscus syriacus]|uniref:uncharacterized protein LOC120178237 n=1 Tax=Hibiscus syriacus TaxID=106335 RepID=UPI001924D35B|nr:uncharacterized protein LOC120178237 [Hibiscus syriacus]